MGAFMLRPHSVEPAQPKSIDLNIEYLNHREFLEHVRVGPEACRVFCPGTVAAPPSTPVQLNVGFVGESQRFQLEGRVVSRREALHPSLPAGLVVDIREPHLAVFSRLFAYASRRPADWGRRAFERVSVDILVSFELHGEAQAGVLRDLSHGGAFVATPGPRPLPGTLIQLVGLVPPEHPDGSGRLVGLPCRKGRVRCGVQQGASIDKRRHPPRGPVWTRSGIHFSRPFLAAVPTRQRLVTRRHRPPNRWLRPGWRGAPAQLRARPRRWGVGAPPRRWPSSFLLWSLWEWTRIWSLHPPSKTHASFIF